jgi:glycosyltransferase involved in cell wall biosynthesis
MKTTIVLPTYNEANNLEAMAKALWKLPLPGLTLLVVDDASPDGTGQLADQLAAANPGRLQVLHRTGMLGLGTAYIHGFQRALADGAEVVVQMDCDFSHSPAYLPHFIACLKEYDLVIGSRYVPGGQLDPKWGKGRVLLSAWANVPGPTSMPARCSASAFTTPQPASRSGAARPCWAWAWSASTPTATFFKWRWLTWPTAWAIACWKRRSSSKTGASANPR